MSFLSFIKGTFPFGGSPPTQYGSDAYIIKTGPGTEYYDTTGAGYYGETRFIGNAIWNAVNAQYTPSAGGWVQQTTTSPSYALVVGNGLIQLATAVAGAATPIVWTYTSLTPTTSSQGIFNPLNYGAVGNGITDDSGAILAAYAAAAAFANASPNNNACVVFPPLRFGYANATPISPAENVSTFAYPGAEINRLSTATDCFLFSNVVEISGTFPSVVNFTTGAAFHFLNSSYCRISIAGTNNCLYGVLFDASNGSTNYNVVTCPGEISGNDFSSTGQTNYGVVFRALVSSDNCSANTVNVAALFECYACVAFLTSAASPITAGMAGNAVNAGILTSLGLATPQNGNYGVYCSTNIAPTNNTIFANFMGYNTTADVFWTSLAQNNVVRSYIQSAGSITYPKYTMGGYGNLIQLNNPITAGAAAVAASTTANNRAGWNSGNPTTATYILSSATITGLAAGSNISYYVYSPFVNGSTPISVSIVTNSANSGLVSYAVDNSGTNANEIKVTFVNPTASAITTTLQFVVKVGV
jgi:hypothetical protein